MTWFGLALLPLVHAAAGTTRWPLPKRSPFESVTLVPPAGVVACVRASVPPTFAPNAIVPWKPKAHGVALPGKLNGRSTMPVTPAAKRGGGVPLGVLAFV